MTPRTTNSHIRQRRSRRTPLLKLGAAVLVIGVSAALLGSTERSRAPIQRFVPARWRR